MSKEFNYKRAWTEYVKPEFQKLPQTILRAFYETIKEIDNIKQSRDTHSVVGQSENLTALFDSLLVDELAWAGQVVYYYGHLASDKSAQAGGLYWKFQILADTSVIKRGAASTALHDAKAKMDQALKAFHDHVEGTEYTTEEIPGFLYSISPSLGKDLLKIISVRHANHKPDVFCVGPVHITNSTGIDLDPNVAPCATCRQPYSAHTYETVMFVQPILGAGENIDTVLKNKEPQIKEVLQVIKTLCLAASIKIDGFVMVKPSEVEAL